MEPTLSHFRRIFTRAAFARAASWLFVTLLFTVFAGWDDGATSLFVAGIVPLHGLGALCLWHGCEPEDRPWIAPLVRVTLLLPALLAAGG